MASYIISYDFCKPEQDYENLIKAIKNYSWCKINKSDWVIVATDDASTIRDNLCQYIDENDRLFVGKLSGAAA